MQMDSGVWPGVARISRVTSPSERRWPSRSVSMGNSTVGAVAVADDRPGGGGQLQVAAQEVGMNVGLDDPFDTQPTLGRFAEVDVHVAARI